MKSASAVLKSREEKRQQRIKENQDQINKELLEFEKSLNKYESNIEDDKPYITVETIIKTEEVKSLLKQNGYYIDKESNDIEFNTTRVYLDKFNLIQKNYADLKITDEYNQYTSKEEKVTTKKDKLLNFKQGENLKDLCGNKAYEELTKSNEKTPHTKDEFEENITKLLKNVLGDRNDIKIIRY